MATIFLESGTSATQGFEFWNTNSGTFTSDATSPVRGPRSIKLNTSSPAVSAFVTRTACLADAGRRVSCRFKFSALPAADAAFIQLSTSGNSAVFSIQLSTTGLLKIVPNGVTAITGTRTLTANSPYRIAVSYTVTSTSVWTINVFLNGQLEVTGTSTGTITAVATANLRLLANSTVGANVNHWFEDIYVDSLTSLDDPGNIIVTHKRPNANGTLNDFTTQIGSGGSGYGTGHSPQVNEQPISATNGWSIASASAKVEEYTIENSATGDFDASNARYVLVDYVGWIWSSVGSAGTRNIILNGSASNISVTTSAALYTVVAGSATYPSGATAIGMNNNSVNNITRLFECGILLAYKLPRRISIS